MTSQSDVSLPLVSVVIPAYNSGTYIGAALASVLAQDYPAIEIIVVDDGSTDNTCAEVRRCGSRVRLLKQANQGSAVARNFGVAEAQGHYVAFLDADDVWAPHKVSTQVQALTGTPHRLAYSRFIWWRRGSDGLFPDASLEFERAHNPNISGGLLVTGSPYAELLLDCIVWTSTVLVERAALVAIGGFDAQLRKGQDYDLWLRLSREVSMLGIERPLALYRIHDNNITSSVKSVNFEYLILSRTVARWGETGPDGRKPPSGLVQARLARSSLGHGVAHLHRGDPHIALQALSLSMGHGRAGPKIYFLWLWATCKLVAQKIRLHT